LGVGGLLLDGKKLTLIVIGIIIVVGILTWIFGQMVIEEQNLGLPATLF